MKQLIGLITAAEWDDTWQKWFHQYSRGIPRLGSWLEVHFPPEGLDFLEIGAGSARESRYLAGRARTVTCIDFSPAVVACCKRTNLPANMNAQVMDAFNLGFPNQQFDVSFHKGFWILFSNDAQIASLFKEQVRVTRTTVLALVHNARNERMVRDFERRAKEDKLFQVRFFDPTQLKNFLETELKAAGINGRVCVRKFGGISWIFKFNCPYCFQPIRNRIASLLYVCLPWSRVESVVVEVCLNTQHSSMCTSR
ncbi:MAG: class I SAM-dependent methyltransferase [Terracidiphilus sp.]|jgi:SAM-dependent methyltransferase